MMGAMSLDNFQQCLMTMAAAQQAASPSGKRKSKAPSPAAFAKRARRSTSDVYSDGHQTWGTLVKDDKLTVLETMDPINCNRFVTDQPTVDDGMLTSLICEGLNVNPADKVIHLDKVKNEASCKCRYEQIGKPLVGKDFTEIYRMHAMRFTPAATGASYSLHTDPASGNQYLSNGSFVATCQAQDEALHS